MKFVMLAVIAVLAGPAYGQEGTDPRALEACQAESESFIDIAECLPDAHVAFKRLDAVDELYPTVAATLKGRCLELNDTINGAASCVTVAIRTAVDLSATLPDGAELDDPIFNTLKDRAKLTVLEKAGDDARAQFPDKTYWGGSMYQPFDGQAPSSPEVTDDSLANEIGKLINGD